MSLFTVADQNSLEDALGKAKSGDTISVSGGPYRPFALSTAGVKLSGSGATLDATGSRYGILVRGHETQVTGFEIFGSAGRGIHVQDAHHVYIGSNNVHDNAKVGIYTQRCDFVTIAYNQVWRNGGNERGAGISIHVSEDQWPSLPDKWGRMRVVRNTVWSNFTTGPTEGWGIILDGKYAGTTEYTAYPHIIYVADNVVHKSDAAGILSFGYKNAVLARNSVYDNCHGRHAGEIVLRDTDAATLAHNATTPRSVNVVDYRIQHTKPMVLNWQLAEGRNPRILITGHQQRLPSGSLAP